MTISYVKTGHKKWKYRLTKRYTYYVGNFPDFSHKYFCCKDGNLQIMVGYTWDGASGPAIDTKTIMRASLVHDVLYQSMIYCGVDWNYRKQADKLFRKICLADGMSRFRAWYCYYAVRFGYPVYRKITGKY